MKGFLARTAGAAGSLRAEVVRGSAGSFAVKILNALLSFAVAVALARWLGAEAYGVYSFCLAVLMLTALPAQAGLPQLVVRETAKAQVDGDWALMRGLWRWANRFVLAASLFATLAVAGFLIAVEDPQRTETMVLGLALVPIVAFANVRAASLRGLRRVIHGQLPEGIVHPLTLLLLLGAIVLVGADSAAGPETAMILHVAASIAAFFAGVALLRVARPPDLIRTKARRTEPAAWARAVLPLALITGLHLINSRADTILLGILRSDAEVGIYRTATQMALLVIFGLQGLNQVLQPHFARLHRQGDMARLQRLVTASARAILALALPPVLAYVLFGASLMAFIFGEPFRDGGIALAILALGQLINAGMGSVGMLLTMTGHERDTLKGVAVAAVVNVILNLLLIPSFGMAGAAAATAISQLVW
ncbi:MAG: flippase, partial [Rhodospirillales bacterium]